jgi:hypothetical protein
VQVKDRASQTLRTTVWGKGLRSLTAGSRQLDFDQLMSEEGTGAAALCTIDGTQSMSCTPVRSRLEREAATIKIGGSLSGTLFYRTPGMVQEIAMPVHGVIGSNPGQCGETIDKSPTRCST